MTLLETDGKDDGERSEMLLEVGRVADRMPHRLTSGVLCDGIVPKVGIISVQSSRNRERDEQEVVAEVATVNVDERDGVPSGSLANGRRGDILDERRTRGLGEEKRVLKVPHLVSETCSYNQFISRNSLTESPDLLLARECKVLS